MRIDDNDNDNDNHTPRQQEPRAPPKDRPADGQERCGKEEGDSIPDEVGHHHQEEAQRRQPENRQDNHNESRHHLLRKEKRDAQSVSLIPHECEPDAAAAAEILPPPEEIQQHQHHEGKHKAVKTKHKSGGREHDDGLHPPKAKQQQDHHSHHHSGHSRSSSTKKKQSHHPKHSSNLPAQKYVAAAASNQDDEWNKNWAMIIVMVVFIAIVAEIVAIWVYFAAVNDGSIDFFGQDMYNQKESETNAVAAAVEHYIHDAVVASSALATTMSLSELVATAECVGASPKEIQSLVKEIPTIVDQALEKSTEEPARIVEYTDETFEISENLQGTIKGTTLACTIVLGWRDGVSPAAYASHLVASTLDIPPDRKEADAYNMSMLMEADVIELGAMGMLLVPEKYCFDLGAAANNNNNNDDPPHDGTGILTGANMIPLHSTLQLSPKTIMMGGKAIALNSYGNRVSLLTGTRNDTLLNLIRDAYRDPKAELLGFLDAFARKQCPNGFDPDCTIAAKAIVQEEFGLEWDENAQETAIQQIVYMYLRHEDWKAHRDEMAFTGIDLSKYNGSANSGEINVATTPFLFDPSIASFAKNALNEWLYPTFADPNLNQSEFERRIQQTSTTTEDESSLCVVSSEENNDSNLLKTTASYHAAQLLPGSILRRLYEFDGELQENISNWYIDMDTMYREWAYPWNEQYLTQNVEWDEGGNLKYGNLTEKRTGRTARWFMINDFSNPDQLLELYGRQQHGASSIDAYARAAASAVDPENDCGKAATDTDIFVLVLAVLSANFGAVKAIVESLHFVHHWISIRVWPHRTRAVRMQGLATVLPTYELYLTMIGGIIFVGLYVPLILRVTQEFQIFNYHATATDMVIHNSEKLGLEHVFYGVASLVTLVYAESECIEARPFLLLLILVTGFVVGVVINLPTIHMTLLVLCRYFQRLKHLGEHDNDVPDGCDVYQKQLRILLDYMDDFENTATTTYCEDLRHGSDGQFDDEPNVVA